MRREIMDPELLLALERLKEAREEKHAAESDAEEFQNQALPLLAKEDPENKGVPVEVYGQLYEAHIQQNRTPEFWDMEKLVPWLKKNGHWAYVMTEVLDQAKLDAEIKAGNISRREIRKFMLKGTPPRPFIRFDRKKRTIKIKRRYKR